MLSQALEYANRGWPIFPVRADKKPYIKGGVIEATTDPKQIRKWWTKWPMANIALDVGGANMMVVDLDPPWEMVNGKKIYSEFDYDTAMDALEEAVGTLPDTKLSVTTPRNGEHLYFSIGNDEVVAPSGSKLAKHVDVRSFHSYVLLPPSRTSDGVYEWSSEGKPAFRSDELYRRANTGREKHEDRDTWTIEKDLEENVELAVKWLQEDAKIAIQGQGGDHIAYATAAHMKSYGISEALAFDLMWEHWNPRCLPPWSPDEIEHFAKKVENGHTYNTSPPGNITPAYAAAKHAALFSPVSCEMESGNEWSAGRFRVVDRDGMEAIKPAEWLIKDLIPQKSYTLLIGDRGTFKTFLALDMALSIAVGIGMDGTSNWREIVKSGPVLYCAGEGRSGIKRRVRAWEKRHLFGNKVKDFRLADPVPMVSEELQPFIDTVRAASPNGQGYALVVLDTVGRAMQGVNENAQEHASAFTHMVEVIQRELGAAVLCLHHSGHGEKGRARGSSVFGADVDTELVLTRKNKAQTVSLSMTKQKDAPEWEFDLKIKLEEIKLSPGITSLVACKPDPNEPIEEKEEGSRDADLTLKVDMIEEILLEVLASNKVKAYANSPLAQHIACDDRVEIGSQQISRKYLRWIREDSKRKAAPMYDAATQRWRWRD